MTGWNLPPGVNVSDIPGNRPEDIARDNAFDRADADIRAGRFDTDDVLVALKQAIIEDSKGIREALMTDDDAALGDAISVALRQYLAAAILRDNE